MPTRIPAEKFAVGALDAKAVSRLVAAAGDFALMLDGEGTILEVMVNGDDAAAQRARSWRGQRWVQTVAADSRQKVETLLREAQAAADAATARWRQVNHPLEGDEELPLLWSALRLADDARGKPRGRILALGRDLRTLVALQRRLVDTQQAMERDYWRFREAETRYRHLLETSSEAVLVVDGNTQKVLEANPAARALYGAARAKLVGVALSSLFDPGHAERLQDLLAAARSVGKREPIHTRLADGGADVLMSASVFRQEEAAFVLVRLTPVRDDPLLKLAPARRRRTSADAIAGHRWEEVFAAYVQRAADGLVFCDVNGRVMSCNRAFLDLAGLSAEDQARSEPLERWLGRTGVELSVLLSNLRQRSSVSRFLTVLRGEYGTSVEVELSGAQLELGESVMLAIAVRDIERRLKPEGEPGKAMNRSVTELAELVGRTPLKDIVSETTDLIEQLCIETALQMSGDNRASAALLLGLSRQSLYVKLRRYGLGSLGGDEQTLAD